MSAASPSRATRPPLAAGAVLKALGGYKQFVSPLLGPSCRFLPTCADYMSEAVSRHGAIGGVWLGLGRLLRCQPLCRAGHDPVPTRFGVFAGLTGQTRRKEPGPSSR